MAPIGYRLPNTIFRYVFAVSWPHQIALVVLTVITFMLEVVPLEIQRRAVNDLVKERSFRLVLVLCAAYAGVVLIQGSTKLAVNLYRGWVGENAIRDLRRHVLAYLRIARVAAPGSEARGVGAAMLVGEVEPIGGFVGSSLSEPLLQAGIAAGVRAVDAGRDKLPRRRARLGSAAARRQHGRYTRIERDLSDGKRIDRVLQLNMGIYKFKFSMNFLMNLCSHLQVVGALLIGGWMVHTDQLEVGGIVAFISGVGRLNDPWGDLVNYFRDLSLTQVKYSLVADRINQLSERWASVPSDQRTAFRVEA
jgi:ABC-type multidrug transport system fused ATPase/permease subunit